MAVFLTGVTGFIGRNLASRLLKEGHELCLLVRGATDEIARKRTFEALAALEPSGSLPSLDLSVLEEKIHIYRGSLDKKALGLSAAERDEIAARCDQYVHCAAIMRFDVAEDKAWAINVEGTREVLALAQESHKRNALKRLDYVSTAYVAGRRTDIVLESELEAPLGHRNYYESSKFEAERLVREFQKDLPAAIYRPSIVVGDSQSGHTLNFNVMYWPISIYAAGRWNILPGRKDAPIDIVPVDYVSNAIFHIMHRSDSLGRCFHIASGLEGDMRMDQMVALLQEHFPDHAETRYMNPEEWVKLVPQIMRRIDSMNLRFLLHTSLYYIPYFTENPRFDTRNTTAFLSGSGLALPRAQEYFKRLMDYGVAESFGGQEVFDKIPKNWLESISL